LAEPVLSVYLAGLRRTARLEEYEQHRAVHDLIERHQPFIPCYWHQQILLCAIYLVDLKVKHDFNAGFLVSPSRDGEIPARLLRRWGAHVIRGSSSRTGAQAMRDLYIAVTRDGVSPSNTPDGPRGPRFESKPGPLLLSQMTGAPVVPMAAAADSYRQLNSWDRSVIPKWGARMTVVVGAPMTVDKKLRMTELEPLRQSLQDQLNNLTAAAQRIVRQ
jgi:lysophospholipid acyltransferase (LPLAT)-like uncharacterized protein